MEAKRHRVSALLDAQVPVWKICQSVPCSRKLISTVRKLKEDGKGMERKTGSGGHNKKLTDEFLADLKDKIKDSPTTSQRTMAKELQISRRSIGRAVDILGFTSYVRRRRQLLSETTMATRVTKGMKLLTWIKHDKGTIRIFSDKKMWTVDQVRNSQNDRFLAYCVEEVPPILSTKHPASAMMLGVVASDGNRMPPHWFDKGLKINTEAYLNVMESVVKPWIDATYPDGGYVWQQDSAPSHRSRTVQDWCKNNLEQSWPWTIWPPSSPDLSPLDYAIWGEIERKACATPHPNVASLKAAVEKEWMEMSEAYVIKSCKAFRPRLEAMLAANGGHFEK